MTGWTRLGLAGLVALTAGCRGSHAGSWAPIGLSGPGSGGMHAPMVTARQEVAVAALDGRVYVIGGFGPRMSPVATVEAYDPATNEWESRAPLPEPTHHAAAAVADGRLFVVGGFTGGRVGWSASPTVYEYDSRRNAWITRVPMPSPRGALAVAAVGGRLYALGGAAEEVTNAHEVYDPAADRWRIANPMPTARDHLAAVAWQGRVWALGGRRSFTGTRYANVEVYHPATDSWRTGPPLPTGRGGPARPPPGDRTLPFGGDGPVMSVTPAQMYRPA